MDLAALYSGGKDSALAIWKAMQDGHNVKYIVSLHSESDESFMFHVPNIHLTELAAAAMGIEYVKMHTFGEKEVEVNDLAKALAPLDVDGVLSGAVKSTYQMKRVEKVCERLTFASLAPLWGVDEKEIMQDLLDNDFEVLVVGAYANGLDESWLGRKLDEHAFHDLKALNKKYHISIIGEGGEIESLTLDAPMFKKKIEILKAEKHWDGVRGEYLVKKARLVDK